MNESLRVMHRRASDVSSRYRRTVATLYDAHKKAESDDERFLVGYETSALLWTILFEAETLAGVLNATDDCESEDLERFARTLHHKLRDGRRARLLANVEGRTTEEADMFSAKARELQP